MSLIRRFRRQQKRKEEAAAIKRHSRVIFEPLEPRLLLSADLSFSMGGAVNDLTLEMNNIDGVETIQLINNDDPDSATQVVDSQALSETTGVEIIGSEQADRLIVDYSNPFSLPISFLDSTPGDGDVLEVSGGDQTWNITGPDSGAVADITFSGIENLTGAADNEDTFVFSAEGSISGLVEGGDGGFDSLELFGGHFEMTSYTVTGPDSGVIDRDGDILTFAGFEPITDNDAGEKTFSGTSGADVITVSGTGGSVTISGASSGSAFESITYTTPGNITVNASGGNDVINVNAMGSDYNGDITINAGDGADALVINAVTSDGTYTLNGGAGNDTITLDTIGDKTVDLNGGDGDDTYLFSNSVASVGTVNITDPGGNDTVDFTGFSGTLSLSDTGAVGSDGSVISYAAGTIENVVGAEEKIELSTEQVDTFLNGLESLVTWANALKKYGELGMPLPIIAGNIEVGVGEALQIAEALDQIRLRVLNQVNMLATVTTQDILDAISGYVESGIEHLDRAIFGDIKNAVIAETDAMLFNISVNGETAISIAPVMNGVNTLESLRDSINAKIADTDLLGKVQAVISEGRLAIQSIDSEFTSLAVTGVGAAISKLGFKSGTQTVTDELLEGLGELSVSFGTATLVVNVVAGVPEIELNMTPSATRITDFAVDLGAEAGNAGIQFDAGATLAATARLNAELDLRLVLDNAPSFLVDVNSLNASLSMDAAVDADISIGFLGAHVNGTVSMAADPGLTFATGTGINTYQLDAGNIAALTPSFAPTGNSLDLDLGVSLSSPLSGLEVPVTANISIESSNLFTGNRDDVTVTFTDLDELFKFDNMNAAGLAGLFGQLAGWLQSMGNSQLDDIDIPLTHANLGDVLDFKDMFSDILLFDDGDSSILAKKKLVNDLQDSLTAAGLSSQLRVEGDGTSLKLVSIDPDATSFSVTVSGADWLGFGDQSTTDGTLVASSSATLPPDPLPDPLPSDAVLHITINGEVTDVTVSESSLLDNLTVGANIPKLLYVDNSPTFRTAQELADRISLILGTGAFAYNAGESTLSFTIDISRTLFDAELPLNFNLDLSPIADLSSDSALQVDANGNLALTVGIDLEDPDPSTLLTVDTPLSDLNGGDGIDIKTAPSIMGSDEVVSVVDGDNTYYGRFSSDAVFTVSINGGGTETVTITGTDTEGTIGIDASTNRTIIDLVVDVNKALRNAGLQNLDGDGNIDPSSALRADFMGNRLLFTAGTGVTGFTINADADAAGKLGLETGYNTANSRDLLISTQNGTGYYVTLDDATTIGDVIEKIVLATGGSGTVTGTDVIAGLTFGAVEVAWNDSRTGLKLIDKTTDTGSVLAATVLNGSQAGLDLRIVGVDGLDDGGEFDGVINGGQIASVTLADRFYVEDAVVSGDLSVSGNIKASALFGNFVGIALDGNGNLNAGIEMGLKDPGTGTPGGKVTLAELVRGLSNITSVIEAPDFTGGGNFSLAVSTTPDIGSLISLDGTPKVDIGITMANNEPDVEITTQDLENLLKFDTPTFDFNSILNGLIQLTDFLDQFESFGFLNDDIPLIDMSISDVLDFADRLNTAVNEALANPAGTIQTLETKLNEALGLSDGIALSLDTADGDVLQLAIDLGTDFSESVNLSIPEINIPVIGDVLDLGGAADFGASGSLNLSLDLGISLDNPTDVYVYNSTGISGTIEAGGSNLEFMAALGPLGLFIKNGTATISGNISAGLDLDHDGTVDTGGGRMLIGDLLGSLGSNLAIDVGGGLDIKLPTYFPTENISIGAFALPQTNFDWDSLTASDLTSALTLPDFSSIDLSSLGIFDSIMLAVDGLDLFLQGLQDVMDGEVFGLNIPFIGDKLSAGGGFIEDFRQDFIDPFRSFMEEADDFRNNFMNPSQNFVSNLIFDLLGDPLLTGQAWSLDLLKPLAADGSAPDNPDSPLTPNGVEDFIKLDTDGDTYVQWNLSLGGQYGIGTEVDMDIGIPGLGMEADGNIGISFDWDLDLGFGLSMDDGFYLDIGDENELFANVDITLPSSFTGKLAFLQLRAVDSEVYDLHNGMTNLALAFAVDIGNKKDNDDSKLGMCEFSNIDFEAGIAAEAVAELMLYLEVNKDLIGGSAIAAGIPKIQSEFVLDWSVGEYAVADPEASTFVPVAEIGDAIKDGLHYVSFNHVSLDAGSFLSDVLGPIVTEVKKITEPIQPFIDVVTEPIPVLSDLGPPITLLDIAASFGKVDPGLIYSIADIISLINRIPDPDETGTLLIDFGDFTIYDTRGLPGTDQIESELWNPGLKTSGEGGLFDDLKSQVSGLDFGSLLSESNDGGNSNSAKTKSTMSALRSGEAGGGFDFPIFNDPSQIFGLLMGEPAVLVTYDMAPLYFEFEWSTFFSIFGPLGASINIGFSADIDFAFGYDTLGIQQFIEGDFQNPASLLNGFYISDTDQATGAFGVDVPEIVLGGELWAAAELNLGVARAGVGGGIFAEIEFDLFDPNHDGRVRISELILNVENEWNYGTEALAPLAVFDVHGEMTAKLFAFLKIDLFIFEIDLEFDITPPITLLDFDMDFARVPVLATELDNGDLILNMGRYAENRIVDDLNDDIEMLADQPEQFEVNFIDADTVKVRAMNLGSDAMNWQEYDVTGKIIAYGDEGDDSIVFSGAGSSVGYLIEGGVGNDTIILNAATTGAAVIRGDDGSDIIISGGGNDRIWGGRGMDTIEGGAGNDIIFGDDGEITGGNATALVKFDDADDEIYGGAGNDIIFGGGGIDDIAGGDNDDIIIGDAGIVILSDRTASETNRGAVFGNDILSGNSGNDTIYGGRGQDLINGDAGDDTLYGEAGDDIIDGGDNADTIYGLDGNDDIDGGAGDDDIYAGAGDDYVLGGSGDDFIRGNSGNDVIYGDSGADEIYGEGGIDLIYGGHGPDIIDGGAGDDIIFGDAGAVDFEVAYVEPGYNSKVYGANLPKLYSSDLLDGSLPENYIFGQTKSNGYVSDPNEMIDTIYSSAGSDFIDGQAGSDVYIIRYQGADNQSFVNVYDSGIDVAETDYMQVFGTMYDDNFLLRASASLDGLAFVALLNEAPNAERINYWNLERMLVTGSFGDDYFAVDDVRAETTITGDVGEDRFQVGQLYRSPRDANGEYSNVEVEDVFATIETTIGWLSDGINRPMTIYGGVGNDYFTVFHNKAVLSLFGEDGDDTFMIKAFALAGSEEPFRDRTDISGGAGVDLVQYAMNAPVNIDGGDGFDTVIIIGTEFGDDFVITKDGVYGAGLNVNFVNIESLSVDGAEGDDRFYIQSTSEKFITQIFGGLGSDTFNVSGDMPPVISNDLQGHSGVIRHSIETDLSVSMYDETVIAGIAANVYDNDPDQVVVINEADGSTEIMEGGYADSYSIVLSKAPTSDVYVQVLAPVQTQDQKERGSRLFRIDSTNKTAFTPDGTAITLKFTAADWDTPRIVNVSALDSGDPMLDFNDNALEGDATGFINHMVTSEIGITGSPSVIDVTTLTDGTKETTFTATDDLFGTTDPEDDDGLLNLGGYLLLITDGAGAGQSLRVKTVDSADQLTLWGEFRSDYMPDGTSTFKITRDIEAVRAVTVTVHDDDSAGVIIGQTDNSTDLFEDGNTDEITVRLARQPVDNVTVTLLSNDGQLSYSSETVNFNSSNWAAPQTVTVTAENDLFVEGFHHSLISFSVTSGDINTDVTATETITLDTAEAYVGLEHRPKDGQVAEVWVENLYNNTLELRDAELYDVISNKVVFLNSDGSDFEFITGDVKVVYDWVKAGYDNLEVKPVLTNIADNEAAQVLITETGGATNVIENNDGLTGEPWTDTYNVVLTKDPEGDVYVKVTVDMTKASAGRNIFWNQQVVISADDSTAPGATNNADGTVTLKFTEDNWNTPQVVAVEATNDTQYDGDDTQYFAPNLHTVSEIQGPLYLFGEGGAGSVVASDPLMLQYESNIMEPTDTVSVGTSGDTMTVNKDSLLEDARALNAKISTDDAQAIIDLYEQQMTVTIAEGVEEIGQFRQIVGAVDNGETVTLLLNEAWDLSGGDVAEPYSAISKYAVTRMSPNFFAVEAEQIDYVFVYNEDSPADNIGARAGMLQDSTTLGFEGNSLVESFATQMDGKWLSGLGMGSEPLLIGGDYHPYGITYGDMEVMEINMGDGKDEFTITDTHVRADGFQTWTIINTGRGDDIIYTTLNTDVEVLAAGAVTAGGAEGETYFTSDQTFPANTTGVDLKGYLVKITGGSGVGQQRVITGNTADTITVDKAWDVSLDSTSRFEILGTEMHTGTSTAETPETGNTLTDANADFGTDDCLAGRLVEIIDGAGAGAVREIISNTATTLTVSSSWNSALDGTTAYRVYGEQDGPIAVNLQEGVDEFYGSGSSIPLVVFGGADADHIEGGSSEDIIFGDNGRVEYTNEDGKIVTLLGVARELLDPQYLDDWTVNTLTDIDGNFPVQTIDMQGLEGFMLSIPDGKGFGQRALIIDNSTDTLTVSPDWELDLKAMPVGYDPSTDFDPINPQNNPSKYRISLVPEDQTDGVTRDPSLIIATDPEIGGNDTIIGNGGGDRIFGGAADDTISAGDGEDIVFGDHGRLDFTRVQVGGDEGPVRGDFVPATLVRVLTTYEYFGGVDTVYGDAGEDILIGGAGSDRVDGGFGDDLIFGDNVSLNLNPGSGDAIDPRFRTLTGTVIYGADAFAQVAGEFESGIQPVPGGRPAWSDWTITLDQSLDSAKYGDDYIAGGADDDTIFGQLGDDTIQGDGSIDSAVADWSNRVKAYRDTDGTLVVTPSFEAGTDGDDYIEGNSGNDVILGNLGQDDIIGGNSNLFSLITPDLRPDGADLIFGGAGTDISRNDLGDESTDGHGRDADMILGDNGNIYRLVGTNSTGTGSYLSFGYDNYGTLKIIPRAAELLDYTPGGLDYTPTAGDAANDIGAADEIHGESGDDFIYGMTGNDVLFGEGQDDDMIGGYGYDWISGGTGSDGVLGDDGRIYTSRNGIAEPLYGIGDLAGELDQYIYTPGKIQQATINVTGELKKTVNLTPFKLGDPESWDYADRDPQFADDIIYGGWGDDFLHGGDGDDAISGAEALAQFYNNPKNTGDVLRYSDFGRAGEFGAYNEYDPWSRVYVDENGEFVTDGSGTAFLLNFDLEGPNDPYGELYGYTAVSTDGDDAIFGDLGNDWLVGGTGKDHLYGGYGNDLMNADDDQTTNNGANDMPDTHPSYEDLAYGGAGRDVLIANTGGDRLIDWAGEFNSFIVPFAPFGMATVSRALQPQIAEYLYDLSASDGADPTRAADTGSDPDRNGEPEGELGLVKQKDFDWHDQTGAPDDPQPGNIPGGARDVLRFATFNTGTMESFFTDSGVFAVEDGRLSVSAESLGGDAVSVFHVNEMLPVYFEIQATINSDKPTGGWNSNAYVIFDYQSEYDFKFAGINISTNKIQMGHRTEAGWIVDVQSNIKAKPNQDYNMLVAVNGTNVTVLVDGKDVFNYTFAPRVDSDGWVYGLNSGMVGLGSDNSRGSFDNIAVQILPPEVTLDETEEFPNTNGAVDFISETGVWQYIEGKKISTFDGMPDAGSRLAISLIDLESDAGLNISSMLELDTTLKTEGRGGLVFDYYGEDNFKFAVIDADADQVIIGHYTKKGGWVEDASYAMSIEKGVDYDLNLSLKGSTVSVSVKEAGASGWQAIAGHVFNAVTVDGAFGLVTMDGGSSFDDVRVKTDDAAFKDPDDMENLTAAFESNELEPNPELLYAELDPIIDAAINRWMTSTVFDEAMLSRLDDLSFLIADLTGDQLALFVDDTVIIDADAAGHGWFIDDTPYQDSEFKPQGNDTELVAGESSSAFGDMDLLTTVMHEIGHVFGYGDIDPEINPTDIMSGALETGVRHLPAGASQGGISEGSGSLISMDLTPDETDSEDSMSELISSSPWLIKYLVDGAEDEDPNSGIAITLTVEGESDPISADSSVESDILPAAPIKVKGKNK